MDLFIGETSNTVAKAGTFEWAMTLLKSGKFVKRHSVKSDTFITIYKGRMYQLDMLSSVRHTYTPSNKDMLATDWHECGIDESDLVYDDLKGHLDRVNTFLQQQDLLFDFNQWNANYTGAISES